MPRASVLQVGVRSREALPGDGAASRWLLMQVDVSSREEVVRVMELGARNRAVAETKMNERSSRSHSVLTVIVDGISHVTGQRTHGCLHLIDLAGQPCTTCRMEIVMQGKH